MRVQTFGAMVRLRWRLSDRLARPHVLAGERPAAERAAVLLGIG